MMTIQAPTKNKLLLELQSNGDPYSNGVWVNEYKLSFDEDTAIFRGDLPDYTLVEMIHHLRYTYGEANITLRLGDVDDDDVVYCVEVRNMHTAIHELLVFDSEDDAMRASAIIKEAVDQERDIDWGVIKNVDLIEVNYRGKIDNFYLGLDDEIYVVVNSDCMDVY